MYRATAKCFSLLCLVEAWSSTETSSTIFIKNMCILYIIIFPANKNLVYLPRCCSKDKEIARHFQDPRRTRCRRAKSLACDPNVRVLQLQLSVDSLVILSWSCFLRYENRLNQLYCRSRLDTNLVERFGLPFWFMLTSVRPRCTPSTQHW